MLSELSIKNFAIIEKLELSFTEGLTVFTGETGAGKSIIIDAISLLVGGRASQSFVRHGKERADIEGLFLVEEGHAVYEKAKALGIDIQDGMLVLRRTISIKGKSVCRINGRLVTLALLREIGSTLVDIHGQHEHQELLRADEHLAILDEYGGEKLQEARKEYESVFRRYHEKEKEYQKWLRNERENARRLDLIKYQLEEIQKAQLKPGEEEALRHEKRQLVNFEKVYEALTRSYNALYGENKGLDWVSLARSELEEAARLDERFQEKLDAVSSCFYMLEEAAFSLGDELEQLEYDEGRLNEIEGRLAELDSLKRKYGETVEEILEYAATIDEEVEQLKNRDEHVANLQQELSELEKDLELEAGHLSELRKQAAKSLAQAVQKELRDLYMENTEFKVEFRPHEAERQFRQDGAEQCEWMISAGRGEPLKPLAQIASGGELSRIMLSLKSVFSKRHGEKLKIFDEIDTGVSGRVAQAMAEKIYRLSVSSQVFCITHHPQVAAMADRHLRIEKKEENGRTTTIVTPLSETEISAELAKMISGVKMTDLTKQHARELLDSARRKKVNT